MVPRYRDSLPFGRLLYAGRPANTTAIYRLLDYILFVVRERQDGNLPAVSEGERVLEGGVAKM
jgi:hypothetical protein